MTAPAANRNADADRTAARLGRIVIIGAVIIEAIVIALAVFSNHSLGLK